MTQFFKCIPLSAVNILSVGSKFLTQNKNHAICKKTHCFSPGYLKESFLLINYYLSVSFQILEAIFSPSAFMTLLCQITGDLFADLSIWLLEM